MIDIDPRCAINNAIDELEAELAAAERAYHFADDVRARELDEFCEYADTELERLRRELQALPDDDDE